MSEQDTLKLNKSKERQSNIESLRIIAMFLIVAHHFSRHGGFEFVAGITLNKLWIQFIQIGGKIGVNIFVLISGYFLIDVTSCKIKKILKLWTQIFTYSIGIFIICVILGIEPFHIKELIKHILPITYSQWWFASTYFVLYLIYPYLNKLLTSLDKQTYQRLLALTTICWCLIPTFFAISFQSNSLIWFIYVYALSGYIKLHIKNIPISNKKCIMIALTLIIFTFLSAVIFDLIGTKIAFFRENATYFYSLQSLPIILISLFMFLGFLQINIKHNKIINTVASATFGVYLIHDNNYIRKFLWQALFKNATFSNSLYLIPYSIIVIIIVFLICTAIELFRVYVEKHYIKIIDNISNYIEKITNKFFELKIFKY